MCGLGQCSKTTVTQTGGTNGRAERPRRRATCHFRKIHIREMLKSLLAMNRLKDCVLLEFARHVAFYLRVILRCSEFGLVDFVFFSGCHFAFAGF